MKNYWNRWKICTRDVIESSRKIYLSFGFPNFQELSSVIEFLNSKFEISKLSCPTLESANNNRLFYLYGSTLGIGLRELRTRYSRRKYEKTTVVERGEAVLQDVGGVPRRSPPSVFSVIFFVILRVESDSDSDYY